ncbi:hypothetical protein ACSQ67_001944 [Phaseolus vulgaris]
MYCFILRTYVLHFSFLLGITIFGTMRYRRPDVFTVYVGLEARITYNVTTLPQCSLYLWLDIRKEVISCTTYGSHYSIPWDNVVHM